MDLISYSKDSLDISDSEETFFNLAVTIYEGRDFVWLDTPTQIVVKFGKEKKRTAVHPPSKNPYYNEYFVFDFSGLFTQLLDIPLTLKVYHSKYGPVKKGLLASARFDLATIWLQPNHMISRKLVVLSHPNDPRGDIKGYVLCDLGIKSPGVPLPASVEPVGKPTVIHKADYFAPDKMGGGKLKAKYCMRIYRAVGLNVSLEELAADEVSESSASKKGKQKVRVYFAGLSGVTSNRYRRRDPTWNEEIVFTEMFPPLYSRMRVDLFAEKKTFCTRYINLFKISDANIKGFLPTFGPSFLHMYCPVYEYFGSLLISVTTQTVQALPDKKKLVGIKRDPINPIEEHTFWNTDEFVAFAMVNSVSSIDKSQTKQKLVFSMCLADNERNPYDHITNHFLCRPQETIPSPTGNCCRVKDSDVKLTFFIIKTLPDTRHRLFVSNSLEKLTSNLAVEIEKAYACSESDESKATAILLNGVREFLKRSSRIKSREILAFTQLQKERVKVVKHNLEVVQEVFEGLDFRKAPIAFKLKMAAKHCKNIMKLIEDPQDNFPLLIFKVYATNRKVLAYTRFPLREIVFSTDETESGKYCGVMQTLNLKHVRHSHDFFGRMEVYLWFGLYRSVGFALQGLPPGYVDISNLLILPRTITYRVHNIFTCRAHIHQGFFQPCVESAEGLCCTSVKIFVGSQVGTTQTLSKTTSPQWKSTIVIDNVKLYGELSFLKENIPPIAVEVHNHKSSLGTEIVMGRFFATPFIYVSEEEITQNYPPPLMWYKVAHEGSNVGELLAMFELIHRGSVVNGEKQPNLTIIPELEDHIQPKTKKFRMEALFWGIRDVNGRDIVNPAVKIDFGNACFTSQVLQNLYEFPNFQETPQFAEVEIPENILFFPPLIIRVYDGRSFGTSQYVGNCVIKNIIDLKLELVKKKEWEDSIVSKSTASGLNRFHFQLQQKHSFMTFPNIMITGGKPLQNEDEELLPLVKQLSREGPKYTKPPKLDRSGSQHPLLIKLKGVFRRKKVLLQTTFDEDGNLITTASLADKTLRNDPDTNEKLFDWWTKYFEALDKKYIKQQHLKLQASLAVEEEEVSVLKTAKELLKAFGKKDGRKEGVASTWSELKTALSLKCRIPFFTKSKAATIGGKLELDAEALLKSIHTDHWKTSKLVIFDTELERVPSYGGFEDVVRKFPIRKKGLFKYKGSAYTQPIAYLKVGLAFYKMDDEEYVTHFGGSASQGVYSPFMPLLTRQIPLVVRIYLIRAHKLNSKDESQLNPYIQILTSSVTLSNRGNVLLSETSPMFALKFEFKAVLPFDSSIIVRVMDWDKYSEDDLVGDTVIDLENRFFSRHRGSCGLAELYNSEGYNQWRDVYKPSEILDSLCESNNLAPPAYSGRQVVVAGKTFKGIHTDEDVKECAALAALRNWDQIPVVGCHLVPEHVETRSLYRPDAPGVEQGHIELWVDILPELEEFPMPHPTDIKPREPEEFELRIIAWQTKKVMKKDPSLFVLTRHVDIFLAAWMEGKCDRQKTDVHFASTSGHGEFNWRFIFNFYYYRAEKLVVRKTKFDEKLGKKKPPVVYMQVYDKERFRLDDPIGELAIDLSRIPRPELHLLGTHLSVLNAVVSPTIDIFTDRSLRGWFPFTQYTKKGKGPLKTVGYVDLEFNLLYSEEAIANPAGLGRDDPNPMPMPVRPKLKLTVLKVLLAPFRKACFIMCKYHKGKMLKCVLLVGGVLFLALFLINIPRNLSNRMFGPHGGKSS